MIGLIVLYVLSSVWYLVQKKDSRRRQIALWQICLIVMFNTLAHLVSFEQTGDMTIWIAYGSQMLFLAVYQMVFRVFYRDASRLLMNHLCMLLFIGLVMQTRLNPSKAWTQFLIAGLSAAVTSVVPLITRYWKKIYHLRWIFGLFGIVALGVTFLTAQTEYGAKLSVTIGNLSMQLSEIVKVSFVFFVAASFQKSTQFRQVVITTIVAALHVLVLVACRDLGGALILFLSYVFMLYVATRNGWYFLAGMGGGTGACLLAYKLFSHVQVRVQTWLDPWSDVTDKGWQMAQSLFAIGAGGWFGVGLYEGMPGSIPVVIKDFIYAAICEEMGGIFAICLVLIYISCLMHFMGTAMLLKENFHKIVSFGLSSVFAVQILLNIGGVTKCIPLTGVTLPLISYGGSSVLSTFLLFHVVQGFILMLKNEEKQSEKQEKAEVPVAKLRKTSTKQEDKVKRDNGGSRKKGKKDGKKSPQTVQNK